MIHPRLTVTFLHGSPSGQRYTFEGPTRCCVGRADDCDIRLPPSVENGEVFPHHCLLEIAPPRVTVCDLGSPSGIYVNGVKLSARSRIMGQPRGATLSGETELRSGDEIRIGKTVIRVSIQAQHEAGWWPPSAPTGNVARASPL